MQPRNSEGPSPGSVCRRRALIMLALGSLEQLPRSATDYPSVRRARAAVALLSGHPGEGSTILAITACFFLALAAILAHGSPPCGDNPWLSIFYTQVGYIAAVGWVMFGGPCTRVTARYQDAADGEKALKAPPIARQRITSRMRGHGAKTRLEPSSLWADRVGESR